MNTKQFINSSICALFEEKKYTRKYFSLLPKLISPEFLVEQVKISNWKSPNWKLILFVYVFVFVPVFLVQALWSLYNGQFFVDSDLGTKTFLEDYEKKIYSWMKFNDIPALLI